MHDKPPQKISILIPSFNYARYLPTALDSILAQTFEDYEVIVSDDASTDNSAEILRRYAACDSRIRIHIQPANLGFVNNWNWCLSQARGEYIKYLFADDCFARPDALARLLSLLEANPRAVLAISARLVIDEDSRPVEIWDHLCQTGLIPGQTVISRCLCADRNFIGEPSAALFRRAAAKRGFDSRLRQLVDLEYWFHLLQAGDLVYEPEPLCTFRVHAQQQTAKNRHAQVGPEESLLILERYIGLLTSGLGGCLSRFQRQRILYRCLYYSRKRAPRTPEIKTVESLLESRLSTPWFLACWMHHRITKPFGNLRRWLQRQARIRRGASLVPDPFRSWQPLQSAESSSFSSLALVAPGK